MQRPRRILFFAEAVTLAHVARPIALAQGLEQGAYECTIACDSPYAAFLKDGPWTHAPMRSIDSAQFLRALSTGSPVYGLETLRGYVRQDLELIDRFKPDVVVGDFRLSLSVSARLARVPYVSISNAYWSPYSVRQGFPLPVLPMTKMLPLSLAGALFRVASPWVMPKHCEAMNRLRAENGLSQLGADLRRVYTDADHTLYADVPEMFPTEHLPANHRYLGPILWSPPVAPPPWWQDLPADRPIVYLTLGSSGSAQLVGPILQALADRPVTVLAATAGAVVPKDRPANAWIADYLPGLLAAGRSKIVICNGGSPTSQQALANGVPVLGVASNMDQFLNMGAIVDAGAGSVMRADRLRIGDIRQAADDLLAMPQFSLAAQELASAFASHDAPRQFATFVAEVVGNAPLRSQA